MSPYVRDFLISEGVQVPQRLPIETNHQINQRVVLVRNAAVEAEKKIRTIKGLLQPEGGNLHHRTFTSIPGVRTSIKTAGFSSIFEAAINNSMVAETMEEYVIASTEVAYKNPVEQAPDGFMASGGEIQGS